MITREVEIVNPTGLHTRPGNQFVQLAKTFQCDIQVVKKEKEANAKSLLKLLKVGISPGDKITLHCNGEDEEVAMEALTTFIAQLTE